MVCYNVTSIKTYIWWLCMARGRRDDERTARDKLVLDCLRANGRPMTAYDLMDALRDDGLTAPPTVYRVLARLSERGDIHRLQSLNAYMACCQGAHVGLAVFTICDACGSVEEFVAPEVSDQLSRTAAAADFHVTRATVEIAGLCAACASTSPGAQGGAG